MDAERPRGRLQVSHLRSALGLFGFESDGDVAFGSREASHLGHRRGKDNIAGRFRGMHRRALSLAWVIASPFLPAALAAKAAFPGIQIQGLSAARCGRAPLARGIAKIAQFVGGLRDRRHRGMPREHLFELLLATRARRPELADSGPKLRLIETLRQRHPETEHRRATRKQRTYRILVKPAQFLGILQTSSI